MDITLQFYYLAARLDQSCLVSGIDTAVCGMGAWEIMRSGASRLMQKYAVQTCEYCLEVQLGPKDHRVRNCKAYKHQMRDG